MIEVKGNAALIDKPVHVLTVDDIDIRRLHERRFPVCLSSDRYGIGQPFQMIPFLYFRRPGIPRNTQRSDYKDFPNKEHVQDKVKQRRQGNSCFAFSTQAHIKENRSDRMAFDIVDCVLLIIMCYELHSASPPISCKIALICSVLSMQ